MLNAMNEKELVVMEATAEGLKKQGKRRFRVRASVFCVIFRGVTKWQSNSSVAQMATEGSPCWGPP